MLNSSLMVLGWKVDHSTISTAVQADKTLLENHVSPGGIRQNSSISTTGGVDPYWLVFQRPTQALIFVSPPSSNGGSVWGDSNDFTTWDKPQPGTNIAAALFPRGGAGPSELNVFYQTNGSDIIQDSDTVGHFHNSTLPVD